MRSAVPPPLLCGSARDLELGARAIHAHPAADLDEDLLASITEALSRLDRALLATASRLVDADDARASAAEAEALRWYLVETARRSRAAAATCREAKRWALALPTVHAESHRR